LLFLATFASTTTLGAVWLALTHPGAPQDLLPWLSPATIRQVWSDPGLLQPGFLFACSALAILLCHELGHYLACRRYGLPATLPYFLPAPVAIGTFGAFIRIRAPIRTKRVLFDIGVTGPLAGFAALLPFLLYGVARSRPVPLPPLAEGGFLLVPGPSLALELTSRLFHGPLPEGFVLDLHPFALGAWFGLLATAINLLPLGQLDGGHLLYAAVGSVQRRLAVPLWLGLAAAGLLWPGWVLWSLAVLVMGLEHPPVRDEASPLGTGRTVLAWLALLVLVLSFMPVPVAQLG
jgi:membrane-associated protease RseP (regulator of RpoE activity)